MSKYIRDLISQGEHQKLDFKFEISDAAKIARTFSAFANTLGGTLLIGVKDNGVIKGISSDEEAYMADAASSMNTKPPVPFSIETWTVEKKTVLEVKIPESENKPHKAPWKDNTWKAFVRVADENFVADPILLNVWNNQRLGKEILLRYDEVEKKLLDYLNTNESITVKEFMTLCNVKYYKAKKVLVNLVSLRILDYNYIENKIHFHIS
ncbi:MAG: ATP-binding protein [Bacteroidales bacterium]|nr:ATP-binding protein [Bacteroidales bacterium]